MLSRFFVYLRWHVMATIEKRQIVVGKRRGREIEKPPLVTIRYVATDEASQRLSHAVRILLQAAERDHTASGKSMVAKDEKLTLYSPSEEGAEKGQQDA